MWPNLKKLALNSDIDISYHDWFFCDNGIGPTWSSSRWTLSSLLDLSIDIRVGLSPPYSLRVLNFILRLTLLPSLTNFTHCAKYSILYSDQPLQYNTWNATYCTNCRHRILHTAPNTTSCTVTNHCNTLREQEYMWHFNALNSTKNSAIDALAFSTCITCCANWKTFQNVFCSRLSIRSGLNVRTTSFGMSQNHFVDSIKPTRKQPKTWNKTTLSKKGLQNRRVVHWTGTTKGKHSPKRGGVSCKSRD